MITITLKTHQGDRGMVVQAAELLLWEQQLHDGQASCLGQA